MYYMALPILVLVFIGLAGMTRTVRAAMIDTLTQDYIRTARAKGLKEKVVIYSHAWRNALLPVSTSIMGWIVSVSPAVRWLSKQPLPKRHRPAVLAGTEQHRL